MMKMDAAQPSIEGDDPRELAMLELITDVEMLDPLRYLAANPDVAEAGMDAKRHFEQYGQSEGRRQFSNLPDYRRMRIEKLARVNFRRPPHQITPVGEALDYLPEAIRESFDIPTAPPVAENSYAPEIIADIRNNPDHMFLDVGAGFRHVYYDNVINAEIWAAPSTDVVCIGEDLPFEDEQFDHVLCLAVLEHTKRPWIAVQEILRVLKPGGLVRIDWPFLQPFHGYPHHYFNATSKGTISQFEDACDILSAETRPWQHPIFSLGWMLDEWKTGLSGETREAFERMTVGELASRSREDMLREPFCQALSPSVQDTISAGTTLIARKR